VNTKLYTPLLQKEIKEVESYIQKRFEKSNYRLSDNFLAILNAGGKRIRPAFVFLSGELFGENKRDLLRFAAAIEMIHMSTLVHDDIIDHAEERRGKQTLNAKFGNPWALYAGNYLFAEALELIQPEKNKEIAKVMADSAVKIVEGELLQHLALFNTNQTIRDYLKRIRGKTALLLALSCQVGAMAAGQSPEKVKKMYNFGYNLGMAFQIIDDILDIEENAKTKKTKGEDLLNGHINLPALIALKDKDKLSGELDAIIKSKFSNENSFARGIEIIKDKEGINRAKEIAFRYSEKAKSFLSDFKESPVKKELIRITDSLYERNF